MSMQPFRYGRATELAEAVHCLSGDVRPLAGGTDMINLLKERLVEVDSLVSITDIADLSSISECDGALTIGACTRLTELARRDELAKPELSVLRQAIVAAASPQLRHMATLGGNLVQAPRCWYYRNKKTECWRKGGRMCLAFRGENREHVLFDGGPCYAVHPSDPAVALAALGATVRVVGPEGAKTLGLDELYKKPGRDSRQDHVLTEQQLITAVEIPPQGAAIGGYAKVADRGSWDFALVSAAAQLVMTKGIVKQARLYLGGVAQRPWPASKAIEALIGASLNDATIAAATDAATDGAKPLAQNAFKMDLVRGLVRQLLEQLRDQPEA